MTSHPAGVERSAGQRERREKLGDIVAPASSSDDWEALHDGVTKHSWALSWFREEALAIDIDRLNLIEMTESWISNHPQTRSPEVY